MLQVTDLFKDKLTFKQLMRLIDQTDALRMLYALLLKGTDREDAWLQAATFSFVSVSTIQVWDASFRKDGRLKLSRQGRTERRFILEDERYSLMAQEWIRGRGVRKGEASATIADFMKYCNDEILPTIVADSPTGSDPFHGMAFKKVAKEHGTVRREIGLTTARAWLRKLG